MRHDLLSDVMSALKNGDQAGKKETIAPASSLVKDVLMVLQKHGYISEFEHIDDGRGGRFSIKLLGKINDSGAVRPRFSCTLKEYEKFERRFLPAFAFGFIVVSTSKGVMTHTEAKEKKLGGKLLAYIY